MNWADEIAQNILSLRPNLDVYTVASGVSPSGFIHIGNFREIVTPYMVAKSLKKLGKNVRFILSIDNFDRFRKVPGGIPEEWQQYIGKPYVDIPCPFDNTKSYGQYFQERFLKELKALDIVPECIYQSDEYRSGRYAEQIKLAMDKRGEVFDIIDSFRTQDAEEGEKENFYPVSIYCEHCGKDNTTINNYNSDTGEIAYTCACGHKKIINVLTARNIKLQWKVDWPMRWQAENVVYETGGMDHSSLNGSHDVAEKISRQIFGYEPPIYNAYNFIGIKGGGAKMSSSKGNVLTLTDLSKVYDKYLIKWFYGKYMPMQAFNISLDSDVIRYYSEFDRWVKKYFDETIDPLNKSILDLTELSPDYVEYPNFSYLATFLPIVNFDEKLLAEILTKEGVDTTTAKYQERLERAKYWVENYGEEYQVNLLQSPNTEFYNSLNLDEKAWVAKTLDIVNNNYNSANDLQTDLYAVVKSPQLNEQELKATQKRYFQILYNLLLGEKQGPKLGIFLLALSKDKLQQLLKF